jgi:serine/threonine-protein kinase RsbW
VDPELTPAPDELLDAMFAQSHVGFAIFDAQLRFVRVNAAVAAMSRRPVEAHHGLTPGALLGVPDTPGERAMRELLRDGRARAVATLAFEHPDTPGETREFEATYTVLRGTGGRVLGVSAVVLDVSDSRRAEAEREEVRAAAERFGRRALLRAEIGTALESTRGVAQRMQRLAELLVPRFADTATVDIDRAATAHAGTEAGAGAESLVVPLVVRGRAVGTLTVGRGPERRAFDADERLYARDVADRSALSIDNERLYEREQETALALQRSLLAAVQLTVRGFDLAVNYRPTPGELELVGGDWYDAVTRPDGELVLMVGDVVGHGLPAATTMGQLRSAGRALALTVADPGDLLVHLDAFARQTPGATSATVACVIANPDRGELRYACAGHPPPLVVAGGRAAFLDEGRSVPLATFPAPARTSARSWLTQDGSLLLYSDGLVERRGEGLEVGLDRLAGVLAAFGDAPAADIAEGIAPAVLGDVAQRDDIAVLVARRA